MSHVFTRQTLYDLVWSESMSKLAKRFGISDVGLSKACAKANIPKPGLGYWAKVEAGQSVSKISLPSRGPGMCDEVAFGGKGGGSSESTEPNDIKPYSQREFEDIAAVENRVRAAVAAVTVPKSLSNPHRHIARLLANDEIRREKQRTSSFSSLWGEPFFDSQHERRRLRVMNAIFLSLEKNGYVPSAPRKEARELYVHIGDQGLGFVLDWAGKEFGKERHFTNSADAKLPHRLRLEISNHWKSSESLFWEDKDDAMLESQLTEFIVKLIVFGEAQYRAALKWHEEWDIEQAKEKKRRERERRIQIEKEHIDALLHDAASWRKACDLRGYVQAVQSLKQGHIESEKLGRWVSWALRQADKIDPVISMDDVFDNPIPVDD